MPSILVEIIGKARHAEVEGVCGEFRGVDLRRVDLDCGPVLVLTARLAAHERGGDKVAQDAIVLARPACGDVEEERVQLVYRTSHVLHLLPFPAFVLHH